MNTAVATRRKKRSSTESKSNVSNGERYVTFKHLFTWMVGAIFGGLAIMTSCMVWMFDNHSTHPHDGVVTDREMALVVERMDVQHEQIIQNQERLQESVDKLETRIHNSNTMNITEHKDYRADVIQRIMARQTEEVLTDESGMPRSVYTHADDASDKGDGGS